MLYLIEIDWDWIFQRPQILALQLNEYLNIDVLYRFSFNRKNLNTKNKRMKSMEKFIQLPKQQRFKILKRINQLLRYFYSLKIRMKKYDYIWISHPNLFDLIPKKYAGVVVYDCMDLYEDMEPTITKGYLMEKELILVENSDYIFCSSEYLFNKVISMRGNSNNVFILRNGYLSSSTIHEVDNNVIKSEYTLGYIGTLAEWFDYDLVEKSLKLFDNINYQLIGPYVKEYSIEGVNYQGVVPHDKLFSHIEKIDCLIMPFIINNTVLAVDPVKLYEYISFGKCIISVYYPEIARFEPLVYFYNTEEEYISLIDQLIKNGFKPKYDTKTQLNFLGKNSWEARVNVVKEILIS